MKTISRFTHFLLPLLTAGVMALLPQAAQARPNGHLQPVISQFNIDQSDELAPGSDLDFVVEGTPGAKGSVRLSGINRNIVLREVESGVYEGTYTLSGRDRLGPQPTARATLRARNASVTAVKVLAGAAAQPGRPAPQGTASLPGIERFLVTPVGSIEPGTELRFVVIGSPGGRASLNIDSVIQGVPMTEVRPGRYEGGYTIRRNDNFPPSLNIVATLDANGQVVRSRLNQPLLANARPPTIRNMSPRNNEHVGGNPISVSATFDDSGGVGVDPKTVRIVIGTQDVTRNSTITPQSVTWRGQLGAGTYPVEINATDMAGNAMRQAWVFTVAGAQIQPRATVLPLEITNQANNGQVGKGNIEIRGRTAPDTELEVQVQAIASVAGLFGINQPVFNQTLRSDAAGNFAFSFQPQIPVPGARYETTIKATKGELNRELKLVLFQQN